MKFRTAQNQQPLSPRTLAQNRYTTARANLILLVVITVLNVILMAVQSSIYFLFSASIPYFVSLFGAVMYEEGMGITPLIVCMIIALALTLPYLLCWIFSKRNPAWMIGALVYFSLDCVAYVALVIWSGDFTGIIDILFHAWVMYYLIIGVRAAHQLKTLPEELPEEPVDPMAELPQDNQNNSF